MHFRQQFFFCARSSYKDILILLRLTLYNWLHNLLASEHIPTIFYMCHFQKPMEVFQREPTHSSPIQRENPHGPPKQQVRFIAHCERRLCHMQERFSSAGSKLGQKEGIQVNVWLWTYSKGLTQELFRFSDMSACKCHLVFREFPYSPETLMSSFIACWRGLDS